jgi:hypothetical protein
MPPPNVPGYPTARVPAREVMATSGAPHTQPPPRLVQTSGHDIEIRGRTWNLNLPGAVLIGVLSAFGGRLLPQSPAVPPEDSLRRDMKEFAVEQRAQQQDSRETRAGQAQHETQLNAVRADVAGLRSEVRELTRVIEELKRRP